MEFNPTVSLGHEETDTERILLKTTTEIILTKPTSSHKTYKYTHMYACIPSNEKCIIHFKFYNDSWAGTELFLLTSYFNYLLMVLIKAEGLKKSMAEF